MGIGFIKLEGTVSYAVINYCNVVEYLLLWENNNEELLSENEIQGYVQYDPNLVNT